jgi:hypothetical protein
MQLVNPKKIVEIFQSECNYKRINKINNKQIRNHNERLQLSDVFFYRFLYSKKDTTKQQIVSHINERNKTNFTRQSFYSKENNIPLQTYKNIFNKIYNYYSSLNHSKAPKLIAIDGTYNNDINMKDNLNVGFFDVTNNVPVEVISYGHKNKNKEIKCAIKYI